MRTKIDLNYDWEFSFVFTEDFAAGRGPADETVQLPHTCRVTPYNYFDESCYQTICGYRRKIVIPEDAGGKRIFLIAEGAAHSAQVYVDGTPVGDEHRCGYTAFERELTDSLIPGEHIICIRVDSRETQNIPPFGHVVDYMTYSGLYREVRLEIREQSHISDIFVRPSVPQEVSYNGKADQCFDGKLYADITIEGRCSRLLFILTEKGEKAEFFRRELSPGEKPELTIPGVRFWDVQSPVLYELEVQMYDGDRLADSRTVTLGFRRAQFRRDGFYLNGRKFRIRGLDRHQSFPHVGYAMPRSIQRLDAEILKNELGLNAVRTSHYPQSQHFIDRCDELGLLVFTEIPGWQHIGDKQWQDAAVKNTEEMVLQYRNHPSVILWGVRINESPDNDDLYRRTNEAAHRLDPTRPTSGVRCFRKSGLLEDVYAYNDFLHRGNNRGCSPKKKVTPDKSKGYIISEYCGHMFPTKNYDNEARRLDLALRHARILDDVAGEKDISGSFGWCFADYNTHSEFGSGDRICYHGVCDMYRNPKLAAAVYAIQQKKHPVLMVSTTGDIGDHPEGMRGNIYFFTNCDSVQLYRNSRLIGEFEAKNRDYPHLDAAPVQLSDIVGSSLEAEGKYSSSQIKRISAVLNDIARGGTSGMSVASYLKAGSLMLSGISYSELYSLYSKYIGGWGDEAISLELRGITDGKCVITTIVEPFRKACLSAVLSSDALICSATYDAAAVRISMTDQNGNVLPYYCGAVQLRTEGPIELYGSNAAILRGGTGGAYIRTTGRAGKAAVILTDEYGNNCRLELDVKIQEEKT